MLLGRALGERAGGAEIGDLERLLQRQAGRHDLAVNLPYRPFRQGTGIGFGDPPQHLGLALGAIDIAVLDLADAMGDLRPLREQAQHFAVDRVDAIAQLSQFLLVTGHQASRGRYRTARTPSILAMASITFFGTLLSTSTSV